jgi:23S rRNA pseudouridine1911/1915/1917 synthase
VIVPTHTVRVTDDAAGGMRVDRYVADVLGLFSRSQAKVRNLEATVNGSPVRLSHRLKPGDRLSVAYTEPERTDVRPEPVDLSVVYEDSNVVVLNKPCGMVVHPAKGNYSGTLVQGLLWYLGRCDDRIGPSGRPGVVHRLDKDTSGVIVTAKHPEAQEYLAAQFKNRTARKTYLAIVKGSIARRTGRISGYLARDAHNRKRFALTQGAGRWSETEYRVLSVYGAYSFLALAPKTGRTHQLRVHLQSMGHPVLGDPIYARRDDLFPDVPLLLHAYRLRVELPGEGESRTFRAPLPERFTRVLRELARRYR